jgi:SAM-dependent methyltransferase
MAFAAPREGERVLDVGCGTAGTVIELARRVGPQGRVTAFDVSAILLDVAKKNVADAGIATVELVLGDAATHDFAAGAFDVIFSQFGLMFFNESVPAFANLRRALASTGRIAFSCWRDIDANPWLKVPYEAALPYAPPTEPPSPNAPGPLAFADGERVKQILADAGFSEIVCTAHDAELDFGESHEVGAAADHLAHIGLVGRLLGTVDPAAKWGAIAEIAKALQSYGSPERGIRIRAGIWLVSARP